MRQILTLCLLCFLTISLFAQKTIRQDDPPQSYPPTVSKGQLLGSIPALRDLKPHTAPSHVPTKLAQKRNYFFANKLNNPDPQPKNGDPLAKNSANNREGGPEIIPGLNFEGIRDNTGVTPPDPTGDIGKNHYVQMTNASGGSWLQAWDKTTGQSVLGPMLSSTIWGQVGTGSIGDPIVQYDQDAERWIIMELQGFFTNELLIAVSDNSDPTGSWKAYRFQTLGFGDYPKLYVWHNAYIITVNEITSGNECSGYALERSAILAGEPSFDLYRFVMPNYLAIAYQPATGADWEGGPPPPAGSPGYIFRVYDDSWDGGQDHIQIWEVNVDWNNPTQSSITGPDKIFPTPFETKVCYGGGLFDCIEQPDPSAPRITALENIIMYRAPYRNFGAYESVVFNHVTDVSGVVGEGGDAAVRWYELRKQGGGDWQIYQEGTYAPDLVTNRFMGTICTDEAGNIALGYTGASQFTNPGLYLTGRRQSDPLGDMPVEEYTLIAGEQSHYDQRWGDYSNMSVDPEDGRTFWFTGEYQPTGATWGTRIGSFKVQRDTYDLKPQSLLAPQPSAVLGNGELVKVKFYNGGLVDVPGFSASLYFEGNLVATETVPVFIQPGDSYDYTFAATVDMPLVGVDYNFRIISHWAQDQFTRNDTLNEVVQKLTSNDVAAVGKYNLPGQVCGSETDFGIIIRNASGLPLQSAKVHWRINAQPFNIYNWTGNLAPGELDTIDLHATGILNGLNGLKIFTSSPNGVQDERTSNDSIAPIKFTGNLDGTYLIAEGQTDFGVLVWELRSQTNLLLSTGELSTGQTFAQICSDDNTCYRVVLKSSTFTWQGHFRLYNIFGDVIVEAFNATQAEPQVFNICTPQRQQIDMGALALVSPVSGPNLTAAESIKVRFRNFGLTGQSGTEVAYRMNGGAWKTEVHPGVVTAGATIEHTFAATEDLSIFGGIYNFELSATISGDQQINNDTIHAVVWRRALRELEITSIRPVQACNDPSFAFVGITVRNNGLGDEHEFDAKITVNGLPQPTVPNTLFVSPDASVEVILFLQNLQFGQNTVTVDITNVDGQGEDEQPGNDVGTTMLELAPDGYPVQLFFNSNQNPEQNRWEVRDEQSNVVASGGPYPEANGFYAEELCLLKDKCYVFHLFDTGGDGMDGGIVDIFSPLGGSYWTYIGGNFGSEISAPFCTEALCDGFIVDAKVECPAPNNGTITAVTVNGSAPYQYSLNGGVLQLDPVFPNLSFGVYQLLVIDANGCSAEKIIDLCTVSTDEPVQLRTLKVSPNPTSGMASIELPAFEGEQSLVCEVFDTKGKLVQTARLVRWDNTLRGMVILDNAPAGTYFLRVRGLARPLTAKLVKK